MSQPSNDTPRFPNHVPLVVIVSGPAGAGKTSLVNSLLTGSQHCVRAITSTTRAPRRGEINGVDYHFLSPEEFQRSLKAGDFIENASVYGQSYGMPKQNISVAFADEKDLLINIDVQGASTIRKRAKRLKLKDLGYEKAGEASLSEILITVFLMPVSVSQLQERLKKRGTDAPETIQQRLAAVPKEIQRWTEYDYVIRSGALSDDLAKLEGIITAERMRAKRLRMFVESGV